jgi:archaellum component FlaC
MQMKKMGTKKTVEEMVEGLAIAVQHGFEGVSEDMVGFRVELKEVKKDVKEIKERLIGVEKGLTKVEFHSSDMTSRVATLEEKMHMVTKKLGFQ